MKNKLAKKVFILILIEIIALAVLIPFFVNLQTRQSAQSCKSELTEVLDSLPEKIDEAQKAYEKSAAAYDEVYTAKAASLAYMAQNLSDFSYSKIKEYRELLNVTNAFIIDGDGEVLAAAGNYEAVFSSDRFNQLMQTLSTGEASEPFNVEIDGLSLRYYAYSAGDNTVAVVAQDASAYAEIKENNYSWNALLKYDTIGKNGFVFAVSDQDYTFECYPDDSVADMDALEAGLTASFLEDGNVDWININGESYYGAVVHIYDENAYVVSVVPEEEILSLRNLLSALIIFVFFMVITLFISYGIFLLLEDKKIKKDDPNGDDAGPEASERVEEESAGHWFANRKIIRKLAAFMLLGVIAIGGFSWYMNALFSISRSSSNNEAYISEIREEIETTEDKLEDVEDEYETIYLEKAKVAAYILVHEPLLITNSELADLKDYLDVNYIAVFNTKGTTVANSNGFPPFTLSEDEDDQSYEFWKMLNGSMYFVQEARPDDSTGETTQYTAYAMVDDDGEFLGFAQIATEPEDLENMKDQASIETILRNVKAGGTGFALAIDAESGEVVYYPDENKIGLTASEIGVDEDALTDGFSGYLKLDSTGYYCSSAKCGDYYVITAIPSADIGTNGPIIALVSAGACFIFILPVVLVLITDKPFVKKDESRDITSKADGAEKTSDAPAGEGRNISVEMPSGREVKTESLWSRWSNKSMAWSEKTPEQRALSVMRGFLTALAVLVCVMIIFKDYLFDESSAFMYILKGKWEHEINIFSITACIAIACIAAVASWLIRKILMWAANVMGARGETICRLLSSFVKYGAVIIALYYCLALFGVDTTTLLASAGILGLVVGLGAQSLIQDILAGLFIIFEGEFRVGDIVSIDGFRGTVLEIGIRNTKIQDGTNNIKIFSNRNVTGVLNMTRKYSIAVCDVGISYDESLERVESIMSSEIANIRKRLPEIVNGPFYKGVISLGESEVVIRLLAECKEKDRIQLERSMAREMKLLLDKYDIEIPFPQIVVNKPKVKEKATVIDKYKAEAFKKEQEKLSKDINSSEDK